MFKPTPWIIGIAAVGIILLISASALKKFSPLTIASALHGIETKQKDLLVQSGTIAENLQRAETLNTQRASALEDQVKALGRQNAALRSELAKLQGLKGQVTAVAEAVGRIEFGHTDTVMIGDGDFVRTFRDPWIDATVTRRGQALTHSYRTRFKLHEFDVEVQMPDGNKTHLFNAALVSTATGDTLHIPVVRQVIERSASHRALRWRPRAHLLGGAGLGALWGGAGLSVASWGLGRTAEATTFHLAGGMVVSGSDGPAVGAFPLLWNVGRPLPLLDNLSIGAGWLWEDSGSGPVVMIGAAL